MKVFGIFILVMALVSCAQSSGVLKMGPDTYSVSVYAAPVRGGITGAKRIAFKEANEYCTALGKEILISNTALGDSASIGHFYGGTTDITFLCLDKGDTQLKRPNYNPPTKIMPTTPDIAIEHSIK